MKKTIVGIFIVIMGMYVLNLDAGIFRRGYNNYYIPQENCGSMVDHNKYAPEDKVEGTQSILRRDCPSCPNNSTQQNEDTANELINLQQQVVDLTAALEEMNKPEVQEEPVQKDNFVLYGCLGLFAGVVLAIIVKIKDIKAGKAS